jgi:hypothetical protein
MSIIIYLFEFQPPMCSLSPKFLNFIIVHFIIMEKIYKINEQHFTFVRMDNLPALFPNTTPLVRRLSVKCQ